MLGAYKSRGPCSRPTVRRAPRPSDAKHAWKEEETEQRGRWLPSFAWEATEPRPATAEEEGTSQEEEAEAAEEEEGEEDEEHNHPWCPGHHRPRFPDQRHAAHGFKPARERHGAQACQPAREQPQQGGGRLPTFAWDSTETVPAAAKEEGTSQEPDRQQSAAQEEEGEEGEREKGEEHHPSCRESNGRRSRDQRRPARSGGRTGEQRGALASLPAEARCPQAPA